MGEVNGLTPNDRCAILHVTVSMHNPRPEQRIVCDEARRVRRRDTDTLAGDLVVDIAHHGHSLWCAREVTAHAIQPSRA
ncbi:hypothetical protein ABTF07_19560, partial [Acinetobacter baumannii]